MEEIKKILHEGTDAQRKLLFSFGNLTSKEDILKKFELFTRYFYPKFFKSKDAPFHKEAVRRLISVYRGEAHEDFLWIGFRGCSKSTFVKLFVVFVLANDTEHNSRYFKILSSDLQNSKQFVTDVYNMLVGDKIKTLYPELFEKTELKRQETMDIIDFATGVKVVAGTVGQNQRGAVQGFEEASRPDFILFDDIETRSSLRSAVKTRMIWDNMQEAIDGRAKGGKIVYLANYISERGNVHRLVEKVKNKLIVPILQDGKPTWDRFTLAEIEVMKTKAEDWEGEYLCQPSASKDVLVSREEIDKQVAIQPIKETAGFKIFKEYNPSHRIAGAQDVALGVGLDSSTSVFIDFDVMPAQVVGTYHSNTIKPDNFGDEVARQGRIFGECLVAPEKNNAGVATIGRLKQIYPFQRIHATRRKLETIQQATPNELGWDTNSMTKSKMFNDLAEALENGWLHLNDEDLIREAKSYTRNDLMDRDVDARMVTRHYDLLTSCFVKGTMVLTDKGQRPIETLKIGDLVMTREGYKPIINTLSRPEKVITKLGLTGTHDHPVFCNDNQLKELTSVGKGDRLYVWRQDKQKIERLSYTKVLNIIDTQRQNNALTEFTTWEVQQIGKVGSTYIGKSGRIILGVSLKVLSFTIKMGTLTITGLITLKSLLKKTTWNCICKNQREGKYSEKALKKTGIKSQKVLKSTININYEQKSNVSGVLKTIWLWQTIVSFVPNAVNWTIKTVAGGSYLQKKPALYAIKYFTPLFLTKKDVQKSATDLGEEKHTVYNIQVADCPEYFANNILVHNCAIAWQMKDFAVRSSQVYKDPFELRFNKQENFRETNNSYE